MLNIHDIAKLFGIKLLYLHDYATKHILGYQFPISLTRKLAGKSFYYEKYNYHLDTDISVIQHEFDIFCNNFYITKYKMTIREFFTQFYDRKINDLKSVNEILEIVYNLNDMRFINMYQVINNQKFYRHQ